MTTTEPEIIEDERTDTHFDEGDHDKFSHIVFKAKGDKRSAAAIITESMVTGVPIMAYCGKIWVPSDRPEKFLLCPTCREVWEKLSGRPVPK